MKPEDVPEARKSLNEIQSFTLGEVVDAAKRAYEAMNKVPPDISEAAVQWGRFHSFLDSFDKLLSAEERLVRLHSSKRGAPRGSLPW